MSSSVIGYGSSGSAANGTTSVTATAPGGSLAGDLLLIACVAKYAHPDSTPAGLTLLHQNAGGSGSPGADSGDVYVSVYYRKCVRGDAGAVYTFDITGGDTARTAIYRFTKDTRANWDIAATSGISGTPGTSWSATGSTDPGFEAGDMAVVFSGVNGDSPLNFSAETVAASGATFAAMTEVNDSQSSTGDDISVVSAYGSCTAGPSSGVPTFTMTAGASSANSPAGVSVIIRIRDVATFPLYLNNLTTAQAFSTTVNLTVPATINAGDLLVLHCVGKYPTNYPTTPSGWTLAGVARTTTGVGPGIDAGDSWAAIYYKVATGSEGTFTLSTPGGTSGMGHVMRMIPTSGWTYDFAFAGTSMDAASTAVSLTFANPGVYKDDLLFVAIGLNGDAASNPAAFQADADGVIMPAVLRSATATSTGDDCRMISGTIPVNEGFVPGIDTVATSDTVVALTLSSAAAAAGALLRVRMIPPVTYLRRGIGNGLASGVQRAVAGDICAPARPVIESIPLIVAPPRRRWPRRPQQESPACRI